MSDRGSRRLHKIASGQCTTSSPDRGGEGEIERGGEGGRAGGGGGGAITPLFSADLEEGGEVRTAISFQFSFEKTFLGRFSWRSGLERILFVSFFFGLLCVGFLIGKRKSPKFFIFVWSCTPVPVATGNWKAEQKTEPPCELTRADFDESELL